MHPRVHVHLPVSDLDASRAFYAAFLGAEPVKDRPGYVKFLPAVAPLNLALSVGPVGPMLGDVHAGLELASSEAVSAQLERVQAEGLPVRVEWGTDCCHANQDKFWVADPDGRNWEVYHLNHDLSDASDGVPVSLPVSGDASVDGGSCCAPGACVPPPTVIGPG